MNEVIYYNNYTYINDLLCDCEESIIRNKNIYLMIENLHVVAIWVLKELLCLTYIDELEDYILNELYSRNYI